MNSQHGGEDPQGQKKNESNLAESQRFGQVGSWGCTADLRSTYFSTEMFRILGFPAGDAAPSWDEIAKRFAPEVWTLMAELFETARREKIADGEFPAILPDGSSRALRVVAHAVADSAGNVLEFVVTCIDVTEQRRAAAELQQACHEIKRSETQLRAIIDTIPTQLWCSFPDGTNEFSNQTWQDYTGLSSNEGGGLGWLRVMHPEELNEISKDWRSVMDFGGRYDREARIRRFDGVYRWFLCRAAPLRDESGNIVRWCGTNLDIEDRKRAEDALRSSELNFRLIVDSIPGLVCTMSAEGQLELINRQLLEYFGKPHEEMKNWANGDAVHPDDLPHVISEWATSIEAGRPYDIEARCRRGDGVYRWFQVRGLPVRDAEGRVSGWYVLLTDIDDRKKIEDELRQSSERYRVVVETASDAVISMDQTGTILLANPATARVFGYNPAELIGKPLTLLMPEYMRKLHEAGFNRYMDTGQRHINWQGTELIGLRKNGEEFPVMVSFGELTRNGRSIFTGFMRDISDQKRAAEALRRSESYLAEAQRLTHTGSWAGNILTRQIFHSSDEHSRLYGFDPARGIPSFDELYERVHPDDLTRLVEAFDNASRDGIDAEVNYRIVAPDGAVRHVEVVGHPVMKPSGEKGEFVGFLMDVTERRQAEEERERLREALADLARINRVSTMGELTASLAHEIRQPISAAVTDARTCLRWLGREKPDITEAQEAASRLVKDVTRASEIISRISSLFKKDAMQRELLDVNELIQEMVDLLRSEADRHSISIDSEVARDLPVILADRIQLQQVFMNLMINGIEAIKDTGTPGKLTIKSQQDENRQLLISVADTGVGLRPEHSEQMFKAFFTSKAQGTGMGLPISRSIIEWHGGRLWATPNTGQGAIFQFTLPFEIAASQTS